MNWILGFVGALFGVVLWESENFYGALIGFLLIFLLVSLSQLRQRFNAAERELLVLKGRLAAGAGIKSAEMPATPAPAATPAATPVTEAAAETAGAADAVLTSVAEAAPVASVESPVVEPLAPAPAAPDSVAAAASAATITAEVPVAATPRQPPKPQEPDWLETWTGRIKSWFTEGNVPVKIGVLVLFAGVAAALRYAAVQGYFTFPIELRLIVIAVAALAGLGLGWRERERKPAFGLSLQGGALGVLLLTVFAAFRLYGLLPPMLAFAMIVLLVAGAAVLAVLQKNMWLAVLGFLGGYLAPVLISTGSANHVGLFTYYAVLNAAVFAISWKQAWRLLNLVGFFFTFGVGTAWGMKSYRPELFSTVEPFLVLFFLFYIGIGLLYVIRQTEHRRPWVDGTLVFGTPLLAFPLQAGMLKHDRFGMAFSALAVALVYAALVWWLRRRRDERLLTEAYGALALGFATLAVPLAFSASTTASVWALEGAGVAWLGIRQNRHFPWLSGLALQLLAAISYAVSLSDRPFHPVQPETLLLNAGWLGGLLLAFSGYALSLIHDRHRPRFALPPLLFLWATFWGLVAGVTQLGLAKQGIGAWQFSALMVAASLVVAALLRDLLHWPRLNWLVLCCAGLVFILVCWANSEFFSPLARAAWPYWAAVAVAMGWALWSARGQASRSLSLAHLFALWSVALAVTLQAEQFADDHLLAEGWSFLALLAPLALMTVGLWRRPAWLAWPRAEFFSGYAVGWYALAVPLLVVAWGASLFLEGAATPLRFMPLLNPLELASVGTAALLLHLAGAGPAFFKPWQRLWPVAGFAFISMATLRAVHHWHGEPWGHGLLQSGVSQAALAVVWSLLGVGSMLLGSRRHNRPLWMGGMALMLIVCAKLVFVDRQYMGNVPGIVSFLAVGLLLVGVGYFAPSPPKRAEVQGEGA
jgi:uncharacterized membrane protein